MQAGRAEAAAASGLERAMALPVRGERQIIGVIELVGGGPAAFPEEQLSIAAAVSVQLSHFVRRALAHEEIAAREARKAAIVESAVDSIVITDGEGRVRDFNPAAARTFGLDRRRAVATPLEALILPEAQRHLYGHLIGYALRAGAGQAQARPIALPARRADGRELPIEVTAA